MIKNMSTEAFITEFTIFFNNLIKKHKKSESKNDFNNFFLPEPYSIINDKVLSFIANFYQNKSNINKYYDSDIVEQLAIPRIRNIVFHYLEEFYNHDLYGIEDGKYTINNQKIEYQYDKNQHGIKTTNIEYLMDTKRNNENNYLTLIITKDGKTYFSPSSHATLYIWLNMLGIDTKNALRIEWYGPQSNFDISSFYRYDYNTNQENEKFIEITDQQAESLMAIINTLDETYPQYAFTHPDKCALLSYLEKSDNLGLSAWNYNAQVANSNLTLLSKYTNHNTSFSKTKYLKDLYDAAKEF